MISIWGILLLRIWNKLTFKTLIFENFWGPHYSNSQNSIISTGTNLSNFVAPIWKLHNPYCHNSREEAAVFRKVHFIAIHPDFDDVTFEYDLALLWFYESVRFAPNIIPICIPENDYDFHGDAAWVTGWGQIYEGKAKYPL